MVEVSELQVKELVSMAEKISHKYARIYPYIDYSEFNSIAQYAVGVALSGKNITRLNHFVSGCIYNEFNDFIKSKRMVLKVPPIIIPDTEGAVDFTEELLDAVFFSKKEKEAVSHFLKFREPPRSNKGRTAFHRAVKRIRAYLEAQ